jgi:hypothetical protein
VGNVIKFERRQKNSFDKNTCAKDLVQFAENIKHDNCEPDITKVFVIFKQGDEYNFGGWGDITKQESLKVISGLRKFFADIGV